VSRIVAWTGHRPDIFRDVELARQTVELAARELIASGAEQFLLGGQRGVDTWAALTAVAQGVPFRLVLPLPPDEFTHDWVRADRDLLQQTIALAYQVSVAGGYTQRNRQLSSGAHLLVAVWTGIGGGGTAETIQQARLSGTPVREFLLQPSTSASEAVGRGI
jgi:hypothetical protein